MSDSPNNLEIGIGSTVWIFDINRRVYLRGSHSCDYRSHWREERIVGETSISWITSYYGLKIPKKGQRQSGVAFTTKEVDDDVWAKDERYRIVRLVERCPVDVLRKVASLVGFTPSSEGKPR